MKKLDIEFLRDNNLVIFEAIVGSQSYGTNIETSDIDKIFVYMAPFDEILSSKITDYLEVNKDYKGYEISKFLNLLGTANPTVLEILNTPEDCIVFKAPIFNKLIAVKDKFLTKMCLNSFSGYATQQIFKAKGLDKKQNWEKAKTERKDLLDFCYVKQLDREIPWKIWNKHNSFEELFIGATRKKGSIDTYTLYYDKIAEKCFSEKIDEETRYKEKASLKDKGLAFGKGYKGLVKIGDSDEAGVNNYGISNQLRLSSIPKGENPFTEIIYKKDLYTKHCKEFKEYTEWLENRNESRYIETKNNGQKIDGKNVMHCLRTMLMGQEIGQGKGLILRRPDKEYLIDIRRGKFNLEELIEDAKIGIKNMRDYYIDSDLPTNVDSDFVDNLLIEIRKEFYGF